MASGATHPSLLYLLPMTRTKTILAPLYRLIQQHVGLFACMLAFLIAPCIHAEDVNKKASVPTDYRLGSGDKVSIKVYEEAELSMDVVITGSGVINYPFLGEVKLSGRTVTEVESTLTAGLKGPYLVDPKVSVTILEYRQFYIYGEVKQSGGYPYQPDLTLRKAVTLAGGFTERASKTKINVIRERDVKQSPVPIGLDDFIYPGDTVTVGESLF